MRVALISTKRFRRLRLWLTIALAFVFASVGLLVWQNERRAAKFEIARRAIIDDDLRTFSRTLGDAPRLISVKGRHDEVLLDLAARLERPDIVRTLLENGSSVDVLNRSGWTALHGAVQMGSPQAAVVLLDHGAAINARAPLGLEHASDASPLDLAAMHGHGEIVDLLLARGASVHSGHPRTMLPLHWACTWPFYERGSREFPRRIEENPDNRHAIATLNARTGDINIPGPHEMTPLHFALRYGCDRVAELLLTEYPVDLDAADEDGRTAEDYLIEPQRTFLDPEDREHLLELIDDIRRGATSSSQAE